jgi:hypothetical protein
MRRKMRRYRNMSKNRRNGGRRIKRRRNSIR